MKRLSLLIMLLSSAALLTGFSSGHKANVSDTSAWTQCNGTQGVPIYSLHVAGDNLVASSSCTPCSEAYVLLSTDSGATWRFQATFHVINTAPGVHLWFTPIPTFIDDSNRLFVGVGEIGEGHNTYVSTDNGVTWSDLDTSFVQVVSCFATIGQTVFAGSLSEVFVTCFDADEDGIADILVSGICIFKGGATIDALPTYHIGPPNNDTTDFGAYPWVGGGGDYNVDGIPDILLASERGVYGVTSGVFVLVDGRNHPGQYMGYRVFSDYLAGDVNLAGNPESAGDVNGGGVDDIIIGNGGYPYPAYDGFFGIYSGDTAMVAAVKQRPATPEGFKLNQNYPNPFNPSTAISYEPRDFKDIRYAWKGGDYFSEQQKGKSWDSHRVLERN